MEVEIRQIEGALATLRNQLAICTKDIQNLTDLRQLASQDPRSVLKRIVQGATPKPIQIEKIPSSACRSKSRRSLPARTLPKRAITPTSPASSATSTDLAVCSVAVDLKKTPVAKARKLPGYRLFTRTNLEFAREWKDVENDQ
jgi:hypothetical protein